MGAAEHVQAVVRFILAASAGYLLAGWRGAVAGLLILACATSLMSRALELRRRLP